MAFHSTPSSAGIEDHDWCRFTAQDIEVLTDLGDHEANNLIHALEQFRAQFASTLFQIESDDLEADRVAVRLIVFDRVGDFRRVFRTTRMIGFMRPSISTHTLAFAVDRDYEAAFHEFSHYLIRTTSKLNVPSWYDEGLASYLSTYTIRSDGTTAVGNLPYGRAVPTQRDIRQLQSLLNDPFPVHETFRKVVDAYDLAWLLTHYLHQGEFDGDRIESLRRLMLDLDEGRAPNDAFLEHWRMDIEGLEAALILHRQSAFGTSPGPMSDHDLQSIEQQCLSTDDTRVMLADLSAGHGSRRATRWYEQTLAHDPDHVGALIGLSRIAPERADALLDRAEIVEPKHPGVLLRRAEIALNACDDDLEVCRSSVLTAERRFRESLRAADALAANGDPEAAGIQAGAAYGLGVVYLLRNQPGNALGYLKAAIERVPWAPRPNLHLGIAYLDTGNEARARHHLRKAALWDSDPAWREIAAKALRELSN